MASSTLDGKVVAILATDGVEQSELAEPRRAIEEAGGRCEIVSLASGAIQGMQHDEKGTTFPVDRLVGDVGVAEYDGLLLPGGVANPDRLRTDDGAVGLVRGFVESGKPIGVICHGPWTLVEAGAVAGRRLTSWPSLETDIRNAGGQWVDEEVVVDGPLVSSRKPDDLPAFCAAVVDRLARAGSSAG